MSGPGAEAFDPLEMIRVLNEHEVRYVVIGGIAAGVQGAMWATADLDVTYARERDNYDSLAAALRELEAVPVDVPARVCVALDARSLASGPNWTLMTRVGRLDLLGEPGAGLDYASLLPGARLIQGQRSYLVASVRDLLAMKVAVGRPKDIGHAELLRILVDELDARQR